MPDIIDVLDDIAEFYRKVSMDGAPQPRMKDAVTGEPMEQREIFSNNKHIATLDFHKSSGAWFLDLGELKKLASVPNAVDLIRAEEAK